MCKCVDKRVDCMCWDKNNGFCVSVSINKEIVCRCGDNNRGFCVG